MTWPLKFDYGIIIACLALIATLISIRYQIVTMINSQLENRANECNENLDSFSRIPRTADKISGLISAIITSRQLLNYQLRYKKYSILIFLNRQSLVDQFYLQLHTSIREWLKKPNLNNDEIVINKSTDENIQKVNDQIKEGLKRQFKETRKFLKTSIERNETGFFENL